MTSTPEPRGLDAETTAVESFIERVLDARRAVAAAQAAETAALAEAHAFARDVAATVAGATSRAADMELRNLAAQLGAATCVSDRSMQRDLDDAVTLVTRFPATFLAWAEGRIDRSRARVIVDAGTPIDDDDCRAWYERHALERAESLTAGRLRQVARVLAEHAHPVSLSDRHRRARAGRGVRVVDLDDGMARIVADVPAPLARGIHDRLTQMAHQLRRALTMPIDDNGEPVTDGSGDLAAHADANDSGTTTRAASDDVGDDHSDGGDRGNSDSDSGDHGNSDSDDRNDGDGDGDGSVVTSSRRDGNGVTDPRTMDELRADIFADLLLTGVPAGHDDTARTPLGNTSGGLGAIAAHVQITVPVLTALDRSSEPCTMAGYGPIPHQTALDLAGTATGWDRVLTHPVTGAVLDVDRYRPGERLRRHLRARDEHCRHPGCRMPVWRCDLDHTIDHAHGGHTCDTNLANLCRRHHVLKHHTAWTVRQLGNGILKWTSPTGRIYIDTPTPMVRFIPPNDPPPNDPPPF